MHPILHGNLTDSLHLQLITCQRPGDYAGRLCDGATLLHVMTFTRLFTAFNNASNKGWDGAWSWLKLT